MTQVLINSIISGLLLALVALGFHIIFNTTNIFHLAHGGIYVAGAYFFYYIDRIWGFIPGLICTLAFSFMLGILIERVVYKPLKNRANDQNITLISSLGVYIILVNVIALVAGNETKIFNDTIQNSFHIGSLIVTRPQFYEIVWSVPIILFLLGLLYFTDLGLKIRAVANNPTLAGVTGIKIQKIRYIVFGIGSVLAVAAAILSANDIGIDPYSGLTITLSAAVVVIVGGNYSIYGTLIASFALAIIQNFTEYFFTAQWKDAITFAILILILLWRTEGILQYNIRLDEI